MELHDSRTPQLFLGQQLPHPGDDIARLPLLRVFPCALGGGIDKPLGGIGRETEDLDPPIRESLHKLIPLLEFVRDELLFIGSHFINHQFLEIRGDLVPFCKIDREGHRTSPESGVNDVLRYTLKAVGRCNIHGAREAVDLAALHRRVVFGRLQGRGDSPQP